MKKQKLLIIIIILIVIFVIIFLIVRTHFNSKKIIFEGSFMNLSWGFIYDGIIICDDGTIYKFSMYDKGKEYFDSENDINKLNLAILNNRKLYLGKLNKKELEMVKGFLQDFKPENYQYTPKKVNHQAPIDMRI